jgi:non-specific serine/threonine protein kinase
VNVVAAAAAALAASAALGWTQEPELPVPRTEVAAAVSGGDVLVVGGFEADGTVTQRTDLYDPRSREWRRGPDLPQPLHHASAASLRGAAVVLGGYGQGGPTATAIRLRGDAWEELPPLPVVRAAAAAVALRGKLYVVGGVGPRGLAKAMLVYDPVARRWSQARGPSPREHLAAAAAGGRVYVLGGRSAGYDTNTALVESWAPGERRWRRERPLPEGRGGTAAATIAGGTVVSIGGESPRGTHPRVFARDPRTGRWSRLPDLPTSRHGLGAVTLGGATYVVGGGPEPGLTVSGANEVLRAQ